MSHAAGQALGPRITGLFGLFLPVLRPGICLLWQAGDLTGLHHTPALLVVHETQVSYLCLVLWLRMVGESFPWHVILFRCQALYRAGQK